MFAIVLHCILDLPVHYLDAADTANVLAGEELNFGI
jgi:hypothetical protein